MAEPEELEELLEKEEMEVDRESPADIKRTVQVVESELNNLSDIQWTYAKSLLKFGWAAWIFGISAFIASLLMYGGPGLILGAPAVSISLLVGAGAAPVVITVALIQRHRRRIGRLERVRRGLLSQYESTLLKKVGEGIRE